MDQDPSRWPEPDWEARSEASTRALDLLEVRSFANYIHRGHPYAVAMRSANAVPYLTPGQYLMVIRLDDSDEFHRIHAQLKKRAGLKY